MTTAIQTISVGARNLDDAMFKVEGVALGSAHSLAIKNGAMNTKLLGISLKEIRGEYWGPHDGMAWEYVFEAVYEVK